MKTLVLGLGNPILSDDSVGFRIIEQLKAKIDKTGLAFVESCASGLSLLEEIIGYDKLIIIDSIKTKQGKPGQVYKLELENLKPAMDFSSSHGIDVATVFELGRKLGYKIPGDIRLYAVEIKDNTTFSEDCTPEVEERIPFIVEQVIEEGKLKG